MLAAPALRRMLSTIGDLPPGDATAPTDPTFDANLSTGVRNYQARHGLGIDGLLGKATFAALRTPPRARDPADHAHPRALALALPV